MKKKLVLWVALSAMMGLSACADDSKTEDCSNGEKRCDGIDLLICNNNGWKVEVQCDDGMVCNDDTKQCETATITCSDGDKRCDGIDLLICNNNGWKVETQCDDGMVCNDDTHECETSTVICNDDEKRCENNALEYCLENTWTEERLCGDKICNAATYTCDDKLPMITWCRSQHLDSEAKVSYGRVLDSRDSKDPLTITAKLLCGTADQAISEYRAFAGTQNKLCSSCDDTFEYTADLSPLGFGEYLCMWSFAIADEDAVACKTGVAGDIVSDFSTIPTASIALKYAPAGAQELWNTLIDFENFKISLGFTNQETVTLGKVTTKIFGAIMGSPVEKIDGQTLVISNTAADGYVVISNNVSAKLDVLSFDYKSCGAEDFGTDKRELKIYLDEDTTPVHTFKLEGKVNPAKNLSFEIHRNVKSVKIQKTYSGGGLVFPRLAIDNIRLTGTL